MIDALNDKNLKTEDLLEQLQKQAKELKLLNEELERRVEIEVEKRLEKEQLLSAIYDSTSVAISVSDEEGRFVYINKAFASLYGYQESDLLGESFLILVRKEARGVVRDEYKKYLNHEVVDFPTQHEIIRKDGVKKVVLCSRKVVDVSGIRRLLVNFFVDITEQTQLKIEYKKQEDLLIQQSKLASMGEMISAIAHQWRQPLNATGVIVQGILFDYENNQLTQESLKSAVEESMAQIKYMSHTIDSFRNFIRDDKSKESFDLIKAIRDSIGLISAQFNNYKIAIKCTHDVDSISYIGFESEIKQVLINLLINARDAIIANKIASPKIWLTTTKIDEKIKIEVADNGGGIKDDVLTKVFDPYFSTKPQGEGTGIGLYMSKTIIERSFKGTIRAYNRHGGAVFEILI